MIDLSKEYNLVSKNINIDETIPLCTIDGSILQKVVDRSKLNFRVLYMLESNISFNYLNNYNLKEDFIILLSKLPIHVAIYILEGIYSRKKRIYDPLTYLRSELQIIKSNHVDINPKYIPSHCVMMRKVVISPTTMYLLHPTIETSNRVIRRFRDKMDNFLRIQFVDEACGKVGSSNGNNIYALYNRIYHTLNRGIKIGNRHYEFLAFSSSQLRDHSCWFFASTEDLTANHIRDWMGDFTSIKNVAKYAARMGQCFSSTREIQDLPVNNIEEISDIVKNGYTFSDGTGKLSFSLANKIAQELELKYIPSAFQFRLAGYKGVLCQSRFVRGDEIKVRPSQYKFESSHNVLEVIRCSNFIPAYLNRQAITLLSTLGIPDNVFIEMKDLQVNELNKIFNDERTAIKLLQKNSDEYGISRELADLVKAGFLQIKDPYVTNLISLFRLVMLRDLKKKAKIRVEKGAFLLGVLDETQSLNENEIYCCVTDPNGRNGRRVITGTCIVFRNPCFHPGDIRVVTAVNCKNLSNLMDVVVFPATGYRDIPSQCSGGDLDGDDFTIIYDERLIPKKKRIEPMAYEAQRPDYIENVTIEDVQSFFVNYILSDQLGIIANSHLAKADHFETGAFHGQCIRLAQLHSEAVDFPKTGKPAILSSVLRANTFPDFMEKHDKPTYISEKVLGILYRSINEEAFNPSYQMVLDDRLHVQGYKTYVEEARKIKRTYDADIKGLMNQYGVKTEFEVTSGYIVNTIINLERKKSRDINKSVMDAFISIRRHYRKLFEEEFYGKGTNIISPVAHNRMRAKAAAWYFVTYHPAELKGNPSERMISFPWVAYDVLCDIVNETSESNVNNVINIKPNVKNKQKTAGKKSKSNTINVLPKNDDINDDIEVLKRSLN
ncbi:RdRP-domain-containing protein [Rhizophagus irregularis]|nr:RdRP-domain-containing protein [Rhizophagus irregularis]